MKKLSFLLPLSVYALLMLIPCLSYGQLTGNYTINPTKAASNSNYQNWASAISDLTAGSRSDGGTPQGSGVSGAVIFTVYDTVYDNTSITVTAISGASLSNTITFKSASGDSSKCMLRYASGTASTDDWVLNLSGADFITFRQIGFERTGLNTYGTVVQISGDADNNSFVRCLMKGQKLPSSISKGFQTGVGSCVFFSGNGDSTRLTQNRFLYGYNGVYNLIACAGNNFSGNLIDTPGSAGIYVNSQSLFKVTGNTFNMGDFGAGKGHYTCYAIRIDVSSGFLVSGNKAVVTAVNSQVCRSFVFSSNTSTAAAPALICNNSIYNSGGTGNCNGIAINSCAYMNIYYNNILVNNSLTDGAALFQYISTTNSKINLLNNNFINKGGGYALSAGDANASGFDSLDYNNLYSSGTYVALWNSSTGKYSSLSSYQSASGKCANCLSVDPGFASSSDLHVSNIAINGKALPTARVLYDIDNDLRSSTKPDIGSDEFFPVTTDAGISVVDSPSMFCAGKQIVKVKFQNFGSDTLKSLSVGWSVNGVGQTGISWSGSVAPGGYSSSLTLGSYSFAGNTAYSFKIWTSNPNGAPDGKPVNDTLRQTKYAAMSGSYTIGDTSVANYKTFNNAITAMSERGICGAVTFDVFDGIYKEQLGLTQLPGMGSSSPVTFQSISKDSTKVVISLVSAANSGSNNAAVQLRGANYVTFRGITFLRTGTNLYAQVVHIMNGSHHNTFTNCQMIGLPLTSVNATANNIWSDQTQDDYNTFSNNYVKWGNYAMEYIGASPAVHEKGTVIENNVFEGAYISTLRLIYNDNITIRNNRFLNVTASNSTSYDLMMRDCDSNSTVSGNYFHSSNTGRALILNNCQAAAANPLLIVNNSIVKDSAAGMTFDTTANVVTAFNSINFTGSKGSNVGIRTAGNNSNLNISNNNIVMSAGEALHVTSNAEIAASDYNNLYTKGFQFVYWGALQSSLANLITNTGKNSSSLSVDPMFNSGTDLHIVNPLLKGAGTPVTGVTTDFDGDIRNMTTPDIGADEFKLLPYDAGVVTVTRPLANTCMGILPVEAVIRNWGGDTLKNVTINWSVNGIAQTPYNWNGMLATNEKDTVVLGTFNFTTVLPKFIVKAVQPNGQADGIAFNDSVVITRSLLALPAANAGADDTICYGDQVVIGPTGNPASNYKWYIAGSGMLIDSVAKTMVAPVSNTSYVLEVITKATGCSKRDTVAIHVNSLPAADAGADVALCAGDTAKLGAPSQPDRDYAWSSVPSGFSSSASNPTDVPASSTTYILSVTDTKTGCVNTDTADITVAPLPTPQITGTNKICAKGTAVYTTAANTGNTYTWNISGGQILSGQNTNNITVNWASAGSGYLRVQETTSALCSDTAAYNITVDANPVSNFSISLVCKGSGTNFTDLSTGTITGHDWKFGDGGTSSAANPTHTYAGDGAYPVTLIVKNSDGCYDTTTEQAVVYPLPVVDFNINKIGGEKNYSFTDASTISSGSIASWKWKFGDGDSSSVQSPVHQYTSTGNFDVTLCVTSDNGCEQCKIKSQNVVGLFSPSFDNYLTAAPNPGAGLFRITSTKHVDAITVTNTLGQVIMHISPADTSFSIDLSDQPDGIYFVKAAAGNNSSILKLVKQ